MHNFGIPQHSRRGSITSCAAGRTFTYSEGGPEGLLKGKRLILVLASEAFTPTVREATRFSGAVSPRRPRFIGLTDIEVVRVEGVAMSTIGADKALATATAHSREISRARLNQMTRFNQSNIKEERI